MGVNFPYSKVASNLVLGLPSRVKDIVSRRFGLTQENPETLEAIGSVHRITRERVRQIVEDALRQIRKEMETSRNNQTHEVFQHFTDTLKRSGSVKREDLLVDLLGAQDANPVVLLLVIGDEFFDHRETQDFYSFWSLKKEVVELVRQSVTQAVCKIRNRTEAAVNAHEVASICEYVRGSLNVCLHVGVEIQPFSIGFDHPSKKISGERHR